MLAVPDGSTVEVFGPGSPYNAHLTSPVAGFEVADLAGADEELRAAGTEIVLPITGGHERRWLHFRAPDGHLYELVEDRGGRPTVGQDFRTGGGYAFEQKGADGNVYAFPVSSTPSWRTNSSFRRSNTSEPPTR